MTPEQEMRAKAIELNIHWKRTLAHAAITKGHDMTDMSPLMKEDLDQIYLYIANGKLPNKEGKL